MQEDTDITKDDEGITPGQAQGLIKTLADLLGVGILIRGTQRGALRCRSVNRLLAYFILATSPPVKPLPKRQLEASHVAAEYQTQQEMVNAKQGAESAPVKMQSGALIKRRIDRTWPRIQKAGIEVCQQMWGLKQNCSYTFGMSQEDVMNVWQMAKASTFQNGFFCREG